MGEDENIRSQTRTDRVERSVQGMRQNGYKSDTGRVQTGGDAGKQHLRVRDSENLFIAASPGNGYQQSHF